MTMGNDLVVVDAHHHLWDLSRFPYPWLQPEAPARRFGDHSKIKKNYLVKDYLTDLDGLHLVGSVHVQANCGATDPSAETAWLEHVGEGACFPSAIVAQADLSQPDVRDVIARNAVFSRFRGVRTMAEWDQHGLWRFAKGPGLLGDMAYRAGLAVLCDRGLSLDLVVAPEQLIEVADLANAFPSLRICINHLGQPEPSVPQTVIDWRLGMEAISECENVFMKVSGLWVIDRAWSTEILRPFLQRALTLLGPKRLMYGSNLPIERLMIPAPEQISTLRSILEDHGGDIENAFFTENAAQFYEFA